MTVAIIEKENIVQTDIFEIELKNCNLLHAKRK